MPAKTNRLSREKSPYLLQHAHNPVDWFPWGDEAFEKARIEDKPIFLSIGYSTCHWCHVMEKESFEDEEVAALLNEGFVSIKVDREERPDLDHIYMNVCQILTGAGGWPLTILMGWDKKPFYAGTYFPKETQYGRIGMVDMLPRIRDSYRNKRAQLIDSAAKITEALKTIASPIASEDLSADTLDTAFNELEARYDDRRGGFGTAPKFPTPHNLSFLLRYFHRTGSKKALAMVEHTLDAMRRGGIWDHVGGGFHRYSTDANWLLPHFEKMLYDQALIANAATETYQATGNELYRSIAEDIISYVSRDMTSPEGAFYSAEDADSEGVEGKFYVWKKSEIIQILGAEDGDFFSRLFNVSANGNFSEEATGEKTGENILHLKDELKNADSERTYAAMSKLFAARSRRVRPLLDDKTLVDWNGLMIAALAKAAVAFGNDDYAKAASRAAKFVLDKMRAKNGDLSRRYRDGEVAIEGNLDDYAFFVWGLIELYEATFDPDWLERAIEITDTMIAKFKDRDAGGFFFDAGVNPDRITRVKEIYDGATPSGNSVAATNLVRLAKITGNIAYLREFDSIGRAFGGQLARMPNAHCHFMSALDAATGRSIEAVVVGERNSPDTKKMLNILRKDFRPNLSVIYIANDEDRKKLSKIAPFVSDIRIENGKTTVYMCENGRCVTPINDPAELEAELENMSR